MSSSHAANCPGASLTLKRFKVQPCKLRSNPVTSHHFHWCSTNLSLDPSTLTHNFPQTLRISPPTRPSFHCRRSGCWRGQGVWWFRWRAGHRPRPGRDGKQSVNPMTHGWLMAKQQVPNFKQLLMLGYLTSSLNQDFMCQQTACTLILEKTPRVSCIRSPPGLEVIITNIAATQIQPCDCLVPAKGISQGLRKKECQSPSWSIFLDVKKGLRQSRILHTTKWNSCSSISNNNLKLRGPKAYRKDCMLDKSLQIKISYEL